MAFHQHGGFNLHINVDERSSAYFALGLAKGSKSPPVLLCTSGTATANYFPAIIEADKSNVPLIIITADRPLELRNSGSNQTIDQLNLYGNKVRFFCDVPSQTLAKLDKIQIQNELDGLRMLVCEAYLISTRKFENGPVHINFPFSKPLEPKTPKDITHIMKIVIPQNLTRISDDRYSNLTYQKDFSIENTFLDSIINTIKDANRIIVFCGPIEGDRVLASKIVDLANHLELPIFVDVLSGIKFSSLKPTHLVQGFNHLVSSEIISSIEDPDLILHFGRNPISSFVESYMNQLISVKKIQITSDTKWNKPVRSNDIRLNTDAVKFIKYLLSNISQIKQDVNWSKSMVKLNYQVMGVIENRIEDGLEVNIISKILSTLNLEFNLFLSNSLPIRYVDEFAFYSQKKIHIFGNRGASGIDGIVSTASGVAYMTKRPTLLIIGDLALFQDIQGLYNIKNIDINITILVINNNGGGIFKRLPISKFREPFELLFNTPIELNIKKLAMFSDLKYIKLSESVKINSHINNGFSKGIKQVVEFQSDSDLFENFQIKLLDEIKKTYNNF